MIQLISKLIILINNTITQLNLYFTDEKGIILGTTKRWEYEWRSWEGSQRRVAEGVG